MSKDIYHTPYTYLIKFKPTGQAYYGVRFAKGCSPDELWQTYFTSSKVVKSLIEAHGKDAFDYEIRKTFDTADAAREWETQVLQRMKVVNDDNWLNKTNNKSIEAKSGKDHPNYQRNFSSEHRKNLSKSAKGKSKSEEHRKKLSTVNKGKKLSDKTKIKISQSGKGRKHSLETKQKISEKHLGKILTEETRKKISQNKKGKKIKSCSESRRNKIIKSLSNKPKSEDHKKNLSIVHKIKYRCEECDYINISTHISRHHNKTGHSGKIIV